mmetsp:Transcript_92632/g.288319  ORF Transcript_92632/g.288319 Transcript_92632/m.288319 type:complete len:81 (-) Transcript_92632:59-301(-)
MHSGSGAVHGRELTFAGLQRLPTPPALLILPVCRSLQLLAHSLHVWGVAVASGVAVNPAGLLTSSVQGSRGICCQLKAWQ